MRTKHKCEGCGKYAQYYDVCYECCEHDDVCLDERVCLICGKDMTESIMSLAYDRYKDRMKYGD